MCRNRRTWSSGPQFDEKNLDPKIDSFVGNEYLRATMPQFNKAFAGKWNWVNVQRDFSKMNAELITAVQAKGDVPDLFQISLDINTFVSNGAAQDLTAWASAQPWFKDLDSGAIKACTATDGKALLHTAFRTTSGCLCVEGSLPERLSKNTG